MKQVEEYEIVGSARRAYGEARSIAIELLDEIFAKSLGMHIIPPQMVLKETDVVKTALQAGRSGQSSQRSGASSSLAKPTDNPFSSALGSSSVDTPQRSIGNRKLTLKSNLDSNLFSSNKKSAYKSIAQISTVQNIL